MLFNAVKNQKNDGDGYSQEVISLGWNEFKIRGTFVDGILVVADQGIIERGETGTNWGTVVISREGEEKENKTVLIESYKGEYVP